MSPLALRRYRAERLLRRDFQQLRPSVLAGVSARLASRGVSTEALDLEACYAQAWHGLYAALLAGEQVDNPAGWLVVVTFRRAIDDARTWRSRLPAPAGEKEIGREADPAEHVDDIARLRQVFEALRLRLTGCEREAATLCYLQGLPRDQAAACMGISERRMRKLMDGVSGRPGVAAKTAEALATIRNGDWCEQQASLMRALAFGLLDVEGERYRLALLHLRECPACRAYVASLRGLAAVLPPLALPAGLGAGAVGAAGGAAGTAAGGWLVAGGSLTAKLAGGCLLAAGVGAGCLALGGALGPIRPGRTGAHSSDVRHHRPRGRPAATLAPGSLWSSRGRAFAVVPTPGAAPSAARARGGRGSEPAARREFSLEGSSASTASAPAGAPDVHPRARLPSSPPPAPSVRAHREFGFE